MEKRTLAEEKGYITKVGECAYVVKKGFVPNMNVEGKFYVNDKLKDLLFDELEDFASHGGHGGFIPAVKQISNVAALPGIVGYSLGMPDIHSGYGFSIGNVAAFDMANPQAIVSPGGVGFDINCGVRLVRTNLTFKDVEPVKEELAQALFDHIPVGVGSEGVIPTVMRSLEEALEMGIDWSLREGYAWAEDKEHCFAPDTEVLMADGTRRAIGDCGVGDRLVDERGRARTIVRYSSGEDPLYEVVYSNGVVAEDTAHFVCNGGHRLVVFFGFSVFLTAHDATDAAVDPASPVVRYYRVMYHKMMFNEALGFDVPINTSVDFHVDDRVLEHEPDPAAAALAAAEAKYRTNASESKLWYFYERMAKGRCYLTLEKARAAAEAFVQSIAPHLLWEPSVTQYRAFVARYPNLEQCCRMMRAAPAALPDPSPFPSFVQLLDRAYADAEAAGMARVAADSRISPADAAYLVGAWLGSGHKYRACIYMQKPEPGTPSLLDMVAEAAPKLGLEVQALEVPPGEHGSVVSHLPYLHVYLSTATGAPVGPDTNVFVCLLKLLGVFGADSEKSISEAAEQAFLCDSVEVRAALLAGLIDTDGSRCNADWIFTQKDADEATGEQFHRPIALLAWRTALSIGFAASISLRVPTTLPSGLPGRKAVVRITAPADGDLVSPRLMYEYKRVPIRTPDDPSAKRWSRGSQMYRFSVVPTGRGQFVSVEVDGDEHRFLLADYLLVHNCEEYGRMLSADPSKVTQRAKKRGLPQLGTLGAGNHYAEIQVVEEIFDRTAAAKMGIDKKNQICILIHSGSRGLGHQVATDALNQMDKTMSKYKIALNDRQLACAPISSPEGKEYLQAMGAAANFAWVNRQSMTFLVRQAFAKMFHSTPDDLDMHVVYDVSHNIAKIEEHVLVHRKGATRAFPPHHPLIPVDYQFTGQPVLVGGTMGYVLTGTERGMLESFGSTCHGAGRALSRNKSRKTKGYEEVLKELADKGISIRVASPKLVTEEAPEAYKDVTEVVDTCHTAGISKKAVKLRPIAVIKG